MSELIQKDSNRPTIRWKLLTSASALALVTYVSSMAPGKAADGDHPLVWIELDGQLSHQENNEVPFAPPFLFTSPFDAASHLDLEKGQSTVWDKGAKISFEPEGSDWTLTLSARYGKVGRSEVLDRHPTTANESKYNYVHSGYNAYQHFQTKSSDEHFILDFRAGKDVGLGRFGSGGSSVFSAGLRIARFVSHSNVEIESRPTNITSNHPYNKIYASFAAERKFTGVGPSLSWDASALVLGNPSGGSVTLDWGANAAVLFGRQKTTARHQTVEYYWYRFFEHTVYRTAASPIRNKNVTVPNLGGFAGMSWRVSNAKVSVGYRADFFFGATDGGIDAAHRENIGFYGPFASVSVGIGG